MGSKSSSSNKTDNNQTAIDKSTAITEGVGLFDSAITTIDPSDTVLVETVQQHRAAFEVLTDNSTVQLTQVLDLARDVETLHRDEKIQLDERNYGFLQDSIAFLEGERKNGKYVLELADLTSQRSFNLAENVVEGNSDIVSRSLDLVGEVRTDSTGETLKIMVTVMALFGLAAIYLTTKD